MRWTDQVHLSDIVEEVVDALSSGSPSRDCSSTEVLGFMVVLLMLMSMVMTLFEFSTAGIYERIMQRVNGSEHELNSTETLRKR